MIFILLLGMFSLNASAQEALTFDQALSKMIEQDLQVKKSTQERDASKIRSTQTKQNFLPSASLKGSLSKQQIAETTIEQQRTGVSGELNLFKFGGDKAALNAASTELEYSEENLSYLRRTSEYENAKRLLDLIAEQSRLKTSQDLLKLRRDNFEVTKRLVSRGAKPKQELDKVGIDLSNEEVKLQNAEIKAENANADVQSRFENAVTLKFEWPWQNFIAQKKNPNLPTLNIESLPGYKLLSARLKSAESKVAQARSGLLPSLDLTGQHDWVRDLNDGARTREWSGALVLTVPLSQKGTALSSYRQQLIAKQSVEDEIANFKRAKEVQLKLSNDKLAHAYKIWDQSKASAGQAENFYQQSVQFFQRGNLSVNDLNVDQARYYEARFNLVQSWNDVHQALNDICYAYGVALSDCLK